MLGTVAYHATEPTTLTLLSSEKVKEKSSLLLAAFSYPTVSVG